MKVKEITVGVSVPYQKAPYMLGKVEMMEIAVLDPDEDEVICEDELFERLKKSAHKKAREMGGISC